MAMVIIERDEKQAKVSYGSFKNSFERLGWRISGASKSKSHKLPNENTNGEAKASSEVNGESKKASETKDEWDAADEELEMEKSIDEMDMSELKKFAESKGIDTNELKTVGALKKAIKAVM